MDQRSGSADWINAYLEWMGADAGISREVFAVAGVDSGDSWAQETAAVYLDWIDAAPIAAQREAVLLMALRTEAECMHMLHQMLDVEFRTRWPGALERVEADMHFLSDRILELRAH